MSQKAVEVSTKDMFEIQEAVERKAPISEIRDLLKNARLYHTSEESLQLPVARLFERILHQYIVYPDES